MKNGAIEHIPGALLQRGSHSQSQTFGFNLLSFYFLFVNILIVKKADNKKKGGCGGNQRGSQSQMCGRNHFWRQAFQTMLCHNCGDKICVSLLNSMQVYIHLIESQFFVGLNND